MKNWAFSPERRSNQVFMNSTNLEITQKRKEKERKRLEDKKD